MKGAFCMARKSKVELSLKLQLVQSVILGRLSQSEAARRASVDWKTLAEWVRIYRTEGAEGLLPTTKNRVYDPVLKKCAVEDYLSGSGSLNAICEKYKIHSRRQLQNWIKVYTMKLKSLYTGALALAVLCLTSCSDWFDVSPKTNVKAEELYETPEGFESALAGIYILLTDDDCYGHDMSFGLIDQLAQLYDRIPDGTTDREAIYQYTQESQGYSTKARMAAIWEKAYNVIANTNNFMKWLDKNGQRVLKNEQTRNMYYGEAYAMRAFLHFDLLRAWGPMDYQTGKQNLSIPYRVVADNSKQPRLTAEAIVGKIIDDLKQAEQYLAFEKNTSLSGSERRYRLNYYAVKALQARVYCYAGDAENAISCANEVINHCGLTLQTSNSNDPAQFNEALFAINKYKMSDRFSSYFAEGPDFTTQYWVSLHKARRAPQFSKR